MGDMKIGSDKQITAVTQNLKEDQVLEKTMQMLDLEESYAIKLLELDHRIVRVNYKRLKNKVGKIKSHLTPEQVAEIRGIEHEGKLSQGYTSINLSGAIKIAAAAKRLKLGVGMPPRPKPPGLPTAPPPTSTAQSKKKPSRASQREKNTSSSRQIDTEPGRRRRSNSVTGVFVDAPSAETGRQRRSSISNVLITNGNQNEHTIDKPLTAAGGRVHITDGELDNISEAASSMTSSNANKLRATTAHPYTRDDPRNKTKLTRRPQTSHLITRLNKSNFSSHAEESNASTSPTRRPRTTAITSNFYEIGNNNDNDDTFGEDPYEQRRKELLTLENSRHDGFSERKKSFMKNIEEYISAKPFPDPLKNWDIIRFLRNQEQFLRRTNSEQRLATDLNTSGRRKRFKFPGYGGNDTEETTKDVLDSWKGQMRKVRYLRIPEEMIDTSGVNTLARDQIKQRAALKSNAKGGRGFKQLATVND
ncbi:unnamed protein product [Owenia fusiformis]|uniref:Uncharacterized protein n=1 Tax=Owenia fusiformis TaxID=6347 RepID=A0A8J1TW50_OWEFU|nr:unnamed protein product [Owenia fusiformis]